MSGRRAATGAGAMLASLLALGACGGDGGEGAVVVAAEAGDLTITHAAAPAPIGDRPAALYFTVRNRGDRADTLVAIETAAAARAMVHDQRADGGTMVMTPVPALAIPAGATVRLAPGGLHVMLEERRGALVAGDSLRVTLTFRRAGAVPLAAPVVSYGALDAHVGGRAGDATAEHAHD